MLFDSVAFPETIEDISSSAFQISFDDQNGDEESDVLVEIGHEDMSNTTMLWLWDPQERYVYQPDYSQFYHPIVIYGPEDDLVTDFSGTWYLDGDLSALTYIIIDSKGNWSCYQRVPGDPEAARIDCGTFSYSTNESGVYNADSTMYDGVKYRVLDFDEGVLVWGDEGTYYRLGE